MCGKDWFVANCSELCFSLVNGTLSSALWRLEPMLAPDVAVIAMYQKASYWSMYHTRQTDFHWESINPSLSSTNWDSTQKLFLVWNRSLDLMANRGKIDLIANMEIPCCWQFQSNYASNILYSRKAEVSQSPLPFGTEFKLFYFQYILYLQSTAS